MGRPVLFPGNATGPPTDRHLPLASARPPSSAPASRESVLGFFPCCISDPLISLIIAHGLRRARARAMATAASFPLLLRADGTRTSSDNRPPARSSPPPPRRRKKRSGECAVDSAPHQPPSPLYSSPSRLAGDRLGPGERLVRAPPSSSSSPLPPLLCARARC